MVFDALYTGRSIGISNVVYNGPQEIDHFFPMNREHGKINQRKREESILCHEVISRTQNENNPIS